MTGAITRKGKELVIDGVPASRIAEKTGTPVYVYSAAGILEPLKELQIGLRAVNGLVCFAMKSNSNLSVLKLLVREGAGMDLVSGGELFRASQAGTRGDRIVFSGVGKTSEEMKAALKYGKTKTKGIRAFNVESVEELRELDRVAGSLRRIAPVSLRFNPDVDAKTHPYIATGLSDNKFGLDRSELNEAVRLLPELRNVQLKGLSIHIGSQLTSLDPLEEAFISLRKVMADVERGTGIALESLDLGGGLAIRYRDEQPPPISAYCKLVLRHFGPGSGLQRPVQVVVEPGRLLTGASGLLLTRVLFRKERGKKRFLIVDAAMNDLIRPALYEAYHEIVPVQSVSGPTHDTNVVGPVCETADFLGIDRDLPESLTRGDLLAVLNAGAYGFVMSGNYNSRPRAPEVLVQGSKFKIVRRRETQRDLIRGETT